MTARRQTDEPQEIEETHTSDETKALVHLASFSNQNLILIRDGLDADSRTYNAEQMANEIQRKTPKGFELVNIILHGIDGKNKIKFDRAAIELVITLGTIDVDSSKLINHIQKRTPEGKIAILYYMKTEEARKAAAKEASTNKVAELDIRATVRQVGASILNTLAKYIPKNNKNK